MELLFSGEQSLPIGLLVVIRICCFLVVEKLSQPICLVLKQDEKFFSDEAQNFCSIESVQQPEGSGVSRYGEACHGCIIDGTVWACTATDSITKC